MSNVIPFPADRARVIAFDDVDLAKNNFRREMASLFIAAEFNDIPREWLLEHLEGCVTRVRESLTPDNRSLENAAYGK